ncbi:hypothetical protein BDV28DRAFT_135580 [Aspergillus coremiiformis]|uniref:Uncharacterized protein n=1 Tax=Aspergillus coremiiformis TaxID=138285 RepID=A0A5N6Z681_9EURO|nr:hypothetical protein BDV28DRAFT_135580 [Aspergillus coremiiformis]
MSSTDQEGPDPETHRTILLPGKPNRSKSHNKEEETLQRDLGMDRDSRISEEGWKPKIDRRQSWNEEDRKHELQAWLLSVEKGKETGFTECSHDM